MSYPADRTGPLRSHRDLFPPTWSPEWPPAHWPADVIDLAAGTATRKRPTLRRRVLVALAGVLAALAAVVGGAAQAQAMEAPQPDPVVTAPAPAPALRQSRFGPGTWADLLDGYVWVAAPIQMRQPTGQWVGQELAPVNVQEWSAKRGRWVTRAALTSHRGVAAGLVYLGVGRHTVRVQRPQGSTVTATTGRTRTLTLLPSSGQGC